MQLKKKKQVKYGYVAKSEHRTDGGLCIVAMFEGAKGVLVLLTGLGIMSIIHKDVHLAAVQLLHHFHFNPASHYPQIFIDAASHATDMQLWAIASAAFLYSVVRIIEAWGLWTQQQWAEWFGLLTGGMYIPIELYEVMHGVTWSKAAVLTINTAVVAYLLLVVLKTRKKRKAHYMRKDTIS